MFSEPPPPHPKNPLYVNFFQTTSKNPTAWDPELDRKGFATTSGHSNDLLPAATQPSPLLTIKELFKAKGDHEGLQWEESPKACHPPPPACMETSSANARTNWEHTHRSL